MCYFVPYIELAVTHTSVLTILAITVERYYAICLPLQVLQLLNVHTDWLIENVSNLHQTLVCGGEKTKQI